LSKEETFEEFTATYKETNPDATDEDIKALWDAKQTEGLNLTEKVTKMMDEYGNMLIKQLEVRLTARVDELVKSTQDELVASIRKGVGLDKDPVVHLSEVTEVVRKMLLEKDGGDGKQTTDDKGKGPDGKPADDGGQPKFDLEKRFSELSNGRVV